MSSLQLLLWAEVTRVPTLLFTAVVCSRVEPGITPRREGEWRGRRGREGDGGRKMGDGDGGKKGGEKSGRTEKMREKEG